MADRPYIPKLPLSIKRYPNLASLALLLQIIGWCLAAAAILLLFLVFLLGQTIAVAQGIVLAIALCVQAAIFHVCAELIRLLIDVAQDIRASRINLTMRRKSARDERKT